MKVFCNSCGCHFPEDFTATLGKDCTFWKDRQGMQLSDEDKKFLWDWIFSFPYDEWVIEKKLALMIEWKLQPAEMSNEWEKKYNKYQFMSEDEQRDFQREWFTFYNDLVQANKVSDVLFYMFINKWESEHEKDS